MQSDVSSAGNSGSDFARVNDQLRIENGHSDDASKARLVAVDAWKTIDRVVPSETANSPIRVRGGSMTALTHVNGGCPKTLCVAVADVQYVQYKDDHFVNLLKDSKLPKML